MQLLVAAGVVETKEDWVDVGANVVVMDGAGWAVSSKVVVVLSRHPLLPTN